MEYLNARFNKSRITVRCILLMAFSIHVLIAQVVLPKFNHGQDFLFFSTWSLFSGGPRQSIHDLTWDDGNTYFFKDHRSGKLFSKVKIHTLFYLLGSKKFNRIEKDYLPKIKEYCNCDNIEVHRLSGSIYEHVILKKKLNIIDEFKL